MSSRAVHVFEAALRRAVPDTPAAFAKSMAATTFERLLKARAPRAPKNAPPESLGLTPSGTRKTGLENMEPHLVHGGKYKTVAYPTGKNGAMVETTIGPDHADYATKFAHVDEQTGHNPWEPLTRLGHKMQQHIESLSPADQKIAMTDYDHPQHPFHLAYVAKLIKQNLDPTTAHVRDSVRSGGGMSGPLSNIVHARWPNANQDSASNQQPKNHWEDVDRLVTTSSNSASTFARKNVKRAVRAAATTAAANRYMEAARKYGISEDTDPHEFTALAQAMPLKDFSRRRAPKGMLPSHLKSNYNTKATGDFHTRGKLKGQPAWTPSPEFEIPAGQKSHWEDSTAEDGAATLDNYHDLVEHYRSMPRGNGSQPHLRGKTPGIDFMPDHPEIDEAFRKHDAMFGITKPSSGTP